MSIWFLFIISTLSLSPYLLSFILSSWLERLWMKFFYFTYRAFHFQISSWFFFSIFISSLNFPLSSSILFHLASDMYSIWIHLTVCSYSLLNYCGIYIYHLWFHSFLQSVCWVQYLRFCTFLYHLVPLLHVCVFVFLGF